MSLFTKKLDKWIYLTQTQHQNLYTDRYIYLGVKKPWDSYPDPDNIPESQWYKIPKRFGEFNWILCSDPGTFKTVLLSRMISYWKHENFKICITEAKEHDLLNMAHPGSTERLHPGEGAGTTVPTYGIMPSFAMRSEKYRSLKAENDPTLDMIREIYSLSITEIQLLREWEDILKFTEGGGDICHPAVIKGKVKTFEQLYKYVETVDTFHGTKKSVLQKLNRLREDMVFDVPNTGKKDISRIWDMGMIPTILYFLYDTDLMKLDVAKTYQQQLNYVFNYKSKHRKTPKIINVWDDCQMFFDRETDNYAAEQILHSIYMGRSLGFNNIFAVQNPNEATADLPKYCTDIFIGYLRDYRGFDFLNPYCNRLIDDAISMFSAAEFTEEKTVAYVHIPRNYMKSQIFFPAGPGTGVWS